MCREKTAKVIVAQVITLIIGNEGAMESTWCWLSEERVLPKTYLPPASYSPFSLVLQLLVGHTSLLPVSLGCCKRPHTDACFPSGLPDFAGGFFRLLPPHVQLLPLLRSSLLVPLLLSRGALFVHLHICICLSLRGFSATHSL